MKALLITIAIGALCGWLASKVMKSKGGLLWYIVAGIVGGALGKFVAGLLGIGATSTVGTILVGLLGTCLLIWLCRLIFKK